MFPRKQRRERPEQVSRCKNVIEYREWHPQLCERGDFAGLNVKAIQIVTIIVSGTLAGVAGVLLAFFQRGMFC